MAVGRNKSVLAGVSGELTGRMSETVHNEARRGLQPRRLRFVCATKPV